MGLCRGQVLHHPEPSNYDAMSINQIFKATDWHKRWTVNGFTVIGSSFNAYGYVRNMVKHYGVAFTSNFFVYENHSITCYQSQKATDRIGDLVDSKIIRRKNYAKELSRELLGRMKNLRRFMKLAPVGLFEKNNFTEFSRQWHETIPSFVAVTRCGKSLVEPKYKKELGLITKTRLRSESILVETDLYIRKFLNLIAKKEGLSDLDLSVLSFDELLNYVKNGILPKRSVIRYRLLGCGYVYDGEDHFLNLSQAHQLAKKIIGIYGVRPGFAKGQTAYPGLVRGRVRIVLNPSESKNFQAGQVLITGMTRPDFLALMKKSGAIVTDAGGVLSHAAIISREFKKPCVIGTQTATRAFKDGDLVEVDADKGIVKKL